MSVADPLVWGSLKVLLEVLNEVALPSLKVPNVAEPLPVEVQHLEVQHLEEWMVCHQKTE